LVYGQKRRRCFIDNGIWPSTNTECEIERIVVNTYEKTSENNTIRYTDKEIDLVQELRVDGNYFIYFQNCPVVIRLNGSDYLAVLDQRQVKWNRKFMKAGTAKKKADTLLSVSQFATVKQMKCLVWKRGNLLSFLIVSILIHSV
jgi:hypothetical protein